MGRLRELASRLRELESALLDGYREIGESAEREVEKRLAAQIGNFQRLQVVSLELMAEGVPEQFHGLGRITSDDVNLREGPGGKYPLLGSLSQGDLVIILGFSGYWVQVSVPHGPTGFVFKDYVQQETVA